MTFILKLKDLDGQRRKSHAKAAGGKLASRQTLNQSPQNNVWRQQGFPSDKNSQSQGKGLDPGLSDLAGLFFLYQPAASQHLVSFLLQKLQYFSVETSLIPTNRGIEGSLMPRSFRVNKMG